jgi:curved DNA-binding protein CbpA
VIDEEAIRISVLVDHLDEIDYYALLEISRDASADEIRDGFHRFALRFHPDQHVGEPARQRKALTVFKRGAEAYRVLMHPVLRERYDRALGEGLARLPTESIRPPANPAVNTEVPPGARVFYDKAVEAMKKGEYGSAKMHLALAVARGESPAFGKLAREIKEAEARSKK